MRQSFIVVFWLITQVSFAQDSSGFKTSEIIYGRKDGMALTMLRLSPSAKPNGKAIISLVSGNWISSFSMTAAAVRRAAIYINSGYNVFLVLHGSQPRYAIPDQVNDIKRAVRYIKFNAASYGIDSSRIGITGASSGGHLALMTALSNEKIINNGADSIDRVSCALKAVAVFFPPTDFLHWGTVSAAVRKEMMIRARVAAAFDFKFFNRATGLYETIKEDSVSEAIAQTVSPVYSVTADDPPVMIAHGDADPIVPLQQSQVIIARLKKAGVPNELIIKTDGSHGWRDINIEEARFVEWFDKWLK